MPEGHDASASARDRYWRFFWPLALVGISMLVARQFRNRALASYPDAKRELATFALAFSTFAFFDSVLVFVPQMTNRLVRSRGSYRRCQRFTLLVSCAVTAVIAVLALAPPGTWLLRTVFRVDDRMLAPVVRYLRYFLPLALTDGFTRFYTGLLTQAERTGIVTILQIGQLALIAGMLIVGWELGWDPVVTLALSQLVPAAIHLSAAYVFRRALYQLPERREEGRIGWRDILRFFWPVALTGLMFALSRPILFSFLSRVPDGELMIAAVAVSFSVAMVFHMPVNACRDLFVTFGREDLCGVRWFSLKVTAVSFGTMLLVTATPLDHLALRHLLNVKGEILEMAAATFWPLCLVPLVVSLRNYYHGRAMIDRRTLGMGLGGIARNVAVFVIALTLYLTGFLDHVTTAATLVAGFAAEAFSVMLVARFGRRRETDVPVAEDVAT